MSRAPTVSSDRPQQGQSNTAKTAIRTARQIAGENTVPDKERTNEMLRTLTRENVKVLKTNKRELAGTIVFLVLLGAATFFIAFAGHV